MNVQVLSLVCRWCYSWRNFEMWPAVE